MEASDPQHFDILLRILEWAWIGLAGVVTWIVRKMFFLDASINSIESRQQERDKNLERNFAAIDATNQDVLSRLKSIDEHLRNHH